MLTKYSQIYSGTNNNEVPHLSESKSVLPMTFGGCLHEAKYQRQNLVLSIFTSRVLMLHDYPYNEYTVNIPTAVGPSAVTNQVYTKQGTTQDWFKRHSAPGPRKRLREMIVDWVVPRALCLDHSRSRFRV
jgi:hypothetical protein